MALYLQQLELDFGTSCAVAVITCVLKLALEILSNRQKAIHAAKSIS